MGWDSLGPVPTSICVLPPLNSLAGGHFGALGVATDQMRLCRGDIQIGSGAVVAGSRSWSMAAQKWDALLTICGPLGGEIVRHRAEMVRC